MYIVEIKVPWNWVRLRSPIPFWQKIAELRRSYEVDLFHYPSFGSVWKALFFVKIDNTQEFDEIKANILSFVSNYPEVSDAPLFSLHPVPYVGVIEDTVNKFVVSFFEYKQQLYMATYLLVHPEWDNDVHPFGQPEKDVWVL